MTTSRPLGAATFSDPCYFTGRDHSACQVSWRAPEGERRDGRVFCACSCHRGGEIA